jgi:uncharacterized protein YlxW (UPF0749 family)
MERDVENSWHLQKGVPIALILTIALQMVGFVWFLSGLSSQVHEVAKTNVEQDARIGRVEADTRTLQVGAATIAEQLSGLRTSLNELKQEQRETNQLLRQLVQPTP